MRLVNAIKKLEQAGYSVIEWPNLKNKYSAMKEGCRNYIDFHVQDGEVIIIDLRTRGQDDDSMTDYHAGMFCDNLSQAMRLANS